MTPSIIVTAKDFITALNSALDHGKLVHVAFPVLDWSFSVDNWSSLWPKIQQLDSSQPIIVRLFTELNSELVTEHGQPIPYKQVSVFYLSHEEQRITGFTKEQVKDFFKDAEQQSADLILKDATELYQSFKQFE